MHMYHDQNGLAAMLADKRSAGVAPQVNLGNPLQGSKKPRADVARSPKQGNPWFHRKCLMSSKEFNKKNVNKCGLNCVNSLPKYA